MLGLKLNHVSKRGHRCLNICTSFCKIVVKLQLDWCNSMSKIHVIIYRKLNSIWFNFDNDVHLSFELSTWAFEPRTKWPPFCRLHFQMHYIQENFCILIQISLKFVNSQQWFKECLWNNFDQTALEHRLFTESVLWMLMAWSSRTRPSAATILTDISYAQMIKGGEKTWMLTEKFLLFTNSHQTLNETFLATFLRWRDSFNSNQCNTNFITNISMAQRKTAVTPLLAHWSYCSLALSQQYEQY